MSLRFACEPLLTALITIQPDFQASIDNLIVRFPAKQWLVLIESSNLPKPKKDSKLRQVLSKNFGVTVEGFGARALLEAGRGVVRPNKRDVLVVVPIVRGSLECGIATLTRGLARSS
jgi:hypothetical protein